MEGGLSHALKGLVGGHVHASARVKRLQEVAYQETISITGPGEHVPELGPTQKVREGPVLVTGLVVRLCSNPFFSPLW